MDNTKYQEVPWSLVQGMTNLFKARVTGVGTRGRVLTTGPIGYVGMDLTAAMGPRFHADTNAHLMNMGQDKIEGPRGTFTVCQGLLLFNKDLEIVDNRGPVTPSVIFRGPVVWNDLGTVEQDRVFTFEVVVTPPIPITRIEDLKRLMNLSQDFLLRECQVMVDPSAQEVPGAMVPEPLPMFGRMQTEEV